MLLALLAACNEYALEGKPSTPDERPRHDGVETDTSDTSGDTGSEDTGAPPPEEVCDGVDNDGDGAIDEGFDANGDGVVDCFTPEEETYCTPFDDFSGWSYTGTGDWHVENGMLTEGRAGSYAGIAYVSDLGTAGRFLIQVDTAWNSNANDYTGIAWGVQGEGGYIVVWDDPQGYYQRHSPTGAMMLWYCEASCTQLAFDASADLYWPEGMVWVTWSVLVDGDQLLVTVDGAPVLAATVPEIAGSGPRVVGVYSNDNDGGVWFDDFCVWSGS